MDLGNRIDFLFMVAYPALFVGIGLLLAAQGHVRGWVRLVLLVLPVVMTVGDALENRELLVLSAATEPSLMVEPLLRLRLFTVIKWPPSMGGRDSWLSMSGARRDGGGGARSLSRWPRRWVSCP